MPTQNNVNAFFDVAYFIFSRLFIWYLMAAYLFYYRGYTGAIWGIIYRPAMCSYDIWCWRAPD